MIGIAMTAYQALEWQFNRRWNERRWSASLSGVDMRGVGRTAHQALGGQTLEWQALEWCVGCQWLARNIIPKAAPLGSNGTPRARSALTLPCSRGTLKVSFAPMTWITLRVYENTSWIGESLYSPIFSATVHPTRVKFISNILKCWVCTYIFL